MSIPVVLAVVLLAFHGLAAGSTSMTAACCTTNITMLLTSTVTVSYPETTLYVHGNDSCVSGTSMTAATLSTEVVTSRVSIHTHTGLGPAPTTRNATGVSSGGVMTTGDLGNMTMPKSNISQTSAAMSTKEASPRSTKYSTPAVSSPDVVNIHAVPSQVGSTTTLTVETTITELPMVTCTIGQPCAFRGSGATALGSSYATQHITGGHAGGSSVSNLHTPLSDPGSATPDVLLSSSTMTRTVIMKTSGAAFVSSSPAILGSITSIAGSPQSTSDMAHGTASTDANNSPPVNSTSITGTSIISSSTTSTSTIRTSMMSTPSTSMISTSMVSTSMTNMSTASPSSNDTMASTSSSMSSSSSMASVVSSSTMSSVMESMSSAMASMSASMESSSSLPTTPMSITSAPIVPAGPSSSESVHIIPTTKIITLSGIGARASPPRLFTMLLHLFSCLNLASAEFVGTTVVTSTYDPLTTITAAATACAWHPESQNCMTNLGFNNVAVRRDPPVVAALLADVVPIVPAIRKRFDPVLASSTITVTVTLLRTTSTSLDVTEFTGPSTMMLIPASMDFTDIGTSVTSIPPVQGASEGMFTSIGSLTVSIPAANSSSSVTGKPTASGEAGKGSIGGLMAVVGGVVVGLL